MALVFSEDGKAFNVPPDVLEKHRLDRRPGKKEHRLPGRQMSFRAKWKCEQKKKSR